jgi:hypothetical protein
VELEDLMWLDWKIFNPRRKAGSRKNRVEEE